MGRLIIISNRLPFSLDRDGEKVSIRQSSGGLVSSIKSYFENKTAQRGDVSEKMWMGVADFPQEDWDLAVGSNAAHEEYGVIPVFVDRRPVSQLLHNGFSNSVLFWPLVPLFYFPG